MKKTYLLLFLFSTFSYAQFSITGTLTETLESDWVILYKIESTQQVFVANTTIKKGSLVVDGKKAAIGTFSFLLPKGAKSGVYRATYKLKGAGSVDFIFNKENVNFTFNPKSPETTVMFSSAKENIIYRQYLAAISQKQQKLDSIQIAVLRNKTLVLDVEYKKAYREVVAVQKSFLTRTMGKYVHPFVKASLRKIPLEIIKTPQEYMSNVTTTFFDTIDFSDKKLINSTFITNKIIEYVFYVNYSDDQTQQNNLFKKSIDVVLSKIKDPEYKKDIIVFLITKFESINNLESIDYLLENQYKKLPKSIQDQEFVTQKKKLFAAEIGRIAPDFSWTENGKTLQLSTLNSAENYLLIFWSTDCSHCLTEIPQLYDHLQGNKLLKVIAFAMEKNDLRWKKMKTDLPNWHHVLGLKKWQNETAVTYNINATPNYFVLDKNKKIIGKPVLLKDLKIFLEQL
ncbi:thioredoxin-like domain-containing protein [Polaribacter sp.]|nr:thioredoxin-like domain-containing protein [Polaribacter sp.]